MIRLKGYYYLKMTRPLFAVLKILKNLRLDVTCQIGQFFSPIIWSQENNTVSATKAIRETHVENNAVRIVSRG